MNMYILIYINCTERVWGMHVWWNYPPCIQRCNKECLPFNTTLVLRGFIPRFSVTAKASDFFLIVNLILSHVFNSHIHTGTSTTNKMHKPLLNTKKGKENSKLEGEYRICMEIPNLLQKAMGKVT